MTDNDTRTWGTDNDDSLANTFPPCPFPFAPNVDTEALTYLVRQQ